MKTIFKYEIAKLEKQMSSLPWGNRQFYITFMTQTYYFVAHSTRLLALASANTSLTDDSLHRRYSSHIAEEKGHEKLALNDLKKLGVINLEAESPITRNLYETQYYKTERVHPATLFGYILALEGVASLIIPRFFNSIKNEYGPECTHFLKLHVEEDPDHVDKALEVIENLPSEQQKLIEANLIQSVRNYSLFLSECETLAVSKNINTSAEAIFN